MTPEEWARMKEVFDACFELAPAERARYLDEHCREPELRAEVESLLGFYEQAGEFIEQPALDEPVAGRRLGAWVIADKIGEGGIGHVYRVRREGSEFEQVAALKLLKLGLDSGEISRHFLAERRILATLDHPNIARLIDGGLAPDGRPYFVMEFVEGRPINTFVEERGLAPRQICTLVRQVCVAVDYAHRRLVVHRDLKPSNVLVTEAGGVKLLDFGIAKILGDEQAHTATGVRLLTPDYASPEQIRGEPVTTASDIYSLGVMLYRLLCGKSPYRKSGSDLAVAVALERETPEKPSAAAGSTARARELAGDLDTITMKALDPDPARRYGAAAELAADLERYESGHPILARPQTLAYRMRKLIGRNRSAAAVALVAIVAALGGLAATVWEAHVAHRERRRAEQGYYDVRRLANSLLFDVHDAIAGLPGATKARALVLARATEYLDRIATDVPADPALRLEVAMACIRLGDVLGNPGQSNLGDRKRATQYYDKAVALLAPAAGARDLRVQRALAVAYNRLGGLDNARRSLAIREEVAKQRPDDVVTANDLARSYFFMGQALADRQQYPEALEWFNRDRDAMRQLLSARPDDTDLLQQHGQAAKHAGAVLLVLKRDGEALDAYREALRSEERWATLKPEDQLAQMAISYSESDTSLIFWRRKEYAEAIRHCQRSAEIRTREHAADSADDRARRSLWSISARLGTLYVEARQPAKGLVWLLQSEQLARPAGPLAGIDRTRLEDWRTSCADLAHAYAVKGMQAEAQRWKRQQLEAASELERRKRGQPRLPDGGG